MEFRLFERDALIERLAKRFLAIKGYIVPESYRMQSEKNHPRSKVAVAMALATIKELKLILSEREKDEEDE